MTHKIIIMLLIGLFVGAVPGVLLADYEMGADQRSAESSSTADADAWPSSDQVETGAVPGMRNSSDRSVIDTHFNPFYPEENSLKHGGGGGE